MQFSFASFPLFSYGRSQALGSFVPHPCVPVARHGSKHRHQLSRQSQPKVNPPDEPESRPLAMRCLLGDSASVDDDDSSSDERSHMNVRSNRRPSPNAGMIVERTPAGSLHRHAYVSICPPGVPTGQFTTVNPFQQIYEGKTLLNDQDRDGSIDRKSVV